MFNKDDLYEVIEKTGFLLEHKVARAFETCGWNIIGNKYYIDDISGGPREIDLIAYKHTSVAGISLYTTVIISCKKSQDDVWVFLGRKPSPNDPNIERWPVHTWSNSKVIDFQLKLEGFNAAYYKSLIEYNVATLAGMPDLDIFAFQEVNLKKKTAHNDKNIYNSVTSLLKALSYEMKVLPERKKNISIYQFNLLSVVDADLVQFDADKSLSREVNEQLYIAKYIVNERQVFSRVPFIKGTELDRYLEEYNALHSANVSIFNTMEKDFYCDVLHEDRKIEVLISDFRKRVSRRLYSFISSDLREKVKGSSFGLRWDNQRNICIIYVDFSLFDLGLPEILNNSQKAKSVFQDVLNDVYRYQGQFEFDDEIPF